jgi:hypothetical protein
MTKHKGSISKFAPDSNPIKKEISLPEGVIPVNATPLASSFCLVGQELSYYSVYLQNVA